MKKEHLYFGLAGSFVALFSIVFYNQAGLMPTIIVGGSMFAALLLWGATTIKQPSDPKKIIPIFLLTAFLLYFHIGEEYLYNFAGRIGALTGTGWKSNELLVLIAYILPAVWILGVVALYYRNPLGGFISNFIFIGMFIGEPVHLSVFPLIEGGRYHYFPGMWTALLPMVLGIWRLRIILKQYKESKQILG